MAKVWFIAMFVLVSADNKLHTYYIPKPFYDKDVCQRALDHQVNTSHMMPIEAQCLRVTPGKDI